MITIHESTAISFSSLGLGSLPDCVGGVVVEEINGQFELTIQYPITGRRYNELQLRRIIRCKTNPYGTPQPFRIYSISKPINRIVTINAAHLSYDLSGYPVNEFKATSPTDAFTKLKANSQVSHNFTFNSTATTTGEINIEYPKSARSIMGYNILTAYQGEFEYDEFMVYHRQNRGSNRGVSVRYGKNLMTLEQEENISNVYTGVYPYWAGVEYNTETQEQKAIMVKLPEKVVNVPGTFNFTRILPLDMGSEFEAPPTEEELRTKTNEYIAKNKLGEPKISLDVSFIQLTKSKEYATYATLEQIMLGDTVLVEFNELGVNSTARCVKTTYNVVTDRYDEITLGEAKSNLSTSISDTNKEVADKIEQQKTFFDHELGNVKIDIAHIDLAIIEKANIDWVTANFAHLLNGYIDTAEIKDASIGTAKITDASITVAKIENLFADKLTASQGKFTSAHIGELTSDNIAAGAITAGKIDAGAIVTDKLATGSVTAIKIAANSVTADKIIAGAITTAKLDALSVTAEKIAAKTITADKIAADTITANEIAANAITTNELNAKAVTAEKIAADAVTADKILAGSITTGKLAALSVTAEKIAAGAITAEKISTETLDAIAINAGTIVANDITAGKIKITDANILNGEISGAKITDLTVTNAKIANTTIESAKIKDLDVSKLNAGTIDTAKIKLASLDGVLNITNNLIQIKDAQATPKVRVQIGKDTTGNYGIIVANDAGKAIFDSAKGVLIPEGLNNGVVSTDKIVDDAVSPSKIQIEELWADTAYIREFKATSVNTSQLVVDIIRNDIINLQGLISFDSLDDSLNSLFTPSGDKTYINGGMISTGTIKANSIDLYSGITVKKEDGTITFAVSAAGDIEANATLRSSNYKPGVSGYLISTSGTAEFNSINAVGAITNNKAGLSNEGDTDASIRFWAGSDYAGRKTAPFRVTQKGDVFAANGEFTGLLRGTLDSGDVQIFNNRITINKTGTEVETVNIGATQAWFDTDVVFGTGLTYNNANNSLVTTTSFTQNNPKGSIGSNTTILDDVGAYSGYTVLNSSNIDGGSHRIKYWTGHGGLIFESMGTNQTADISREKPYDFKFERQGGDVNVKIQGKMEVTNSINASNQNIEMRSVANEGWGFFAV